MTRLWSLTFGVAILLEFGACSSSVRKPEPARAGFGGDDGGTPSAEHGGQGDAAGTFDAAGETADAGARAFAAGGASGDRSSATGGVGTVGGHAGSGRTEASAGEGGMSHESGEGGGDSAQAGGEGGATTSPPEPLVSCEHFATVPVGSYVVEADYWNDVTCPGTQCLSIDTSTGAFSVTEGPRCGNTVASYPNVLYGSSFGTESPGSVLPKPVSSLQSVTSNWSFDVGGTSSDEFDVAYDIWFCPTAECDATGFAGGLELMIWLNYRNTAGWEFDLGSVALSGYDWEVWTFTAGSVTNSWTYLAYMIRPTMVTSVADFDLLAFIYDAMSRGLLPASSYLYAIQAGNELRSGGLPYTSHDFSVSIE